jgi:hypothetical protein
VPGHGDQRLLGRQGGESFGHTILSGRFAAIE